MPDRGGYAFPYSYKPAQAAVTHTANEHFNPDYFIRVRDGHNILVVEIKGDGDDRIATGPSTATGRSTSPR